MLGIEDLTTTTLVLLIISFFFVSLLFSMLGRGGGEFKLPILIAFLSIPYFDLATISLFNIFGQSAAMVLIYGYRHKMVDWPLAFSLVAVVGIFAFIGGYISFAIKGDYLKGVFAVLLLISAYFMWKGKGVPAKPGNFGVWHRSILTPEGPLEYDMNFLHIIVPTAFVALIAGAVGISGCGMIIPICVVIGGVPIRIAIASNTLLLLASTGSGFLGHAVRGETPWAIAFTLLAGSIAGALIGSMLHVEINEKAIKRLFIIILIVASLWMLYNIL